MQEDSLESIEAVAAMMKDNGATRLYLKRLAPNDNSKNQVYFGGSFDVINMLPLASEFKVEVPSSRKSRIKNREVRMKAFLDFYWLNSVGTPSHAPDAQLILYPQYPEVRFSGFLKKAVWKPSELMDQSKRGRDPGRVLFLGVTGDGKTLGYLAAPESAAAHESINGAFPSVGVFCEVDITHLTAGFDSKAALFNELARIHRKGWIQAKRLSTDGSVVDCNGTNCGGFTLEAELGIRPNSIAGPDYFGWEIKQHDVGDFDKPVNGSITLMTPNPDIGDYATMPLKDFIKVYGYPDTSGRADRTNFGGRHLYGTENSRTNLTLGFKGFDPSSPARFDADGALILWSSSGSVAMGWTFAKMLSHWNKKHERAAYVQSECIKGTPRQYRYGRLIELGEQTEFKYLLSAIVGGTVFYDPGLKLISAYGKPTQVKSRHQLRISSKSLGSLYSSWSCVDLMG